MDYIKEYKSFVTSHYLNDGVRISIGILLPALICGHFGMLPVGMSISLGAMCVSITDNPGPIHHRRNGLIACNIIVFFMALIVGVVHHTHWLFAILLPIFCFIFSMIGVFGTRATSIGIAALLAMVLQMHQQNEGIYILYNSLYLLAGGAWYTLLSLALYSIRPYKLIQQALGEYVMSAADYLRAKASLYEKDVDYDKSNELLLKAQIDAQQRQNLVAELIFKTRDIVKESTNTGRVIMMIFLDAADLFERSMTSHQDYQKLHTYFDETGILAEYNQLIISLANELDTIGIALKSGVKSGYNISIDKELSIEREHLQTLRSSKLNASNIEGFISLRHILDSIDDIALRIHTLHQYTSFDKKISKKKTATPDPEDFISHQDINVKLLLDNLSFRSNIFRHSVRITIAAFAAYLLAQLFPIGHGHSYWILLTVIVILKPAYSLTKQRNKERLIGTVVGVTIASSLLYVVKNETLITIILAISMTLAYSFLRKKYLVSVVMMTLYVILMFHLIDAKDFKSIMSERIIDTCIGSAIAFIFSFIITPLWEYEQIQELAIRLIKDNIRYYNLVANIFTGKTNDKELSNIARKDSLVSLANMSDAFNRMLTEPKSKQKNVHLVHQFVVSGHMLTSHIATLSYYAENLRQEFILADYKPLIVLSTEYLEAAAELLAGNISSPITKESSQVHLLENKINTLMHTRQEELKRGQLESDTKKTLSDFKSITDQFYFIYKVSNDLYKISGKML